MASQQTSVIVQLAEILGTVSVPIGGGLAAYAKWRKGAERSRTAREDAARVASERAATLARQEEQAMRDALLKEKDDRLLSLTTQLAEERAENEKLHKYIVDLLVAQRRNGGSNNGQ